SPDGGALAADADGTDPATIGMDGGPDAARGTDAVEATDAGSGGAEASAAVIDASHDASADVATAREPDARSDAGGADRSLPEVLDDFVEAGVPAPDAAPDVAAIDASAPAPDMSPPMPDVSPPMPDASAPDVSPPPDTAPPTPDASPLPPDAGPAPTGKAFVYVGGGSAV